MSMSTYTFNPDRVPEGKSTMAAHSFTKIFTVLLASTAYVTVLTSPAGSHIQVRQTAPTPKESQALSAEQQQMIVDKHNEFRKTVYPKSKEMKPIVWSQSVADYARDWASCSTWFVHRKGADRKEPWGENLEKCSTSYSLENDITNHIQSALENWWKENESYDYETNECAPGHVCGHYTQMAWWSSAEIGCGYALDCPDQADNTTYNFYLVCNYSPAGNIKGQKPYASDETVASAGKVRTFGGRGKGGLCKFPFTHKGKVFTDCTSLGPGDTPWCESEAGGWGFCYDKADSLAEPCKDTALCEPYKKLVSSSCQLLPESIQNSCCGSSCFKCECLVERGCKNGGEADGVCGCRCAVDSGWTGAKCTYCALTKADCLNGGSFDESKCRCHCPEGYGGFDCGCQNYVGNFPNFSTTVSCTQIAQDSVSLCQCPTWSIPAKKYCPMVCGSCPSIDDFRRGNARYFKPEKQSREVSSATASINVSACASNRCKHGGKCAEETPLLNGFKCTCSEGWRGNHCDISKTLPPLIEIHAKVLDAHNIEVALSPPKCDEKQLSCQRQFDVRLQEVEDGMLGKMRIDTVSGAESPSKHTVEPGTNYRVSGRIRVATSSGDGFGPWCPVVLVTTPEN